MANLCWPVHEYILDIVKPEMILTFGNSDSESPFSYLEKRLGVRGGGKPVDRWILHGVGHPYIDTLTAGHGDWDCKAFLTPTDILIVGLPHLSRYAINDHRQVPKWIRHSKRREKYKARSEELREKMRDFCIHNVKKKTKIIKNNKLTFPINMLPDEEIDLFYHHVVFSKDEIKCFLTTLPRNRSTTQRIRQLKVDIRTEKKEKANLKLPNLIILFFAYSVALIPLLVGLYVGIWLMFVSGFADAINLFKTSVPVGIIDVAIVFFKIVFSISVCLCSLLVALTWFVRTEDLLTNFIKKNEVKLH
jgi:hypothetical protein